MCAPTWVLYMEVYVPCIDVKHPDVTCFGYVLYIKYRHVYPASGSRGSGLGLPLPRARPLQVLGSGVGDGPSRVIETPWEEDLDPWFPTLNFDLSSPRTWSAGPDTVLPGVLWREP